MDDDLMVRAKLVLSQIPHEDLIDAAETFMDRAHQEDVAVWQGLIDILTGKADYIPETDQLIYKEGPKG